MSPSIRIGTLFTVNESSNFLWTPDQLGSDLALWLDAQDEDTLTKSDVDSDGTDEVEVWGDKSGNGNDVSQVKEAKRPEHVVNEDEHDYLAFDAVDDGMVSPATLTNEWGIFCMVESRDTSLNQRWVQADKNRILGGAGGDIGVYVGEYWNGLNDTLNPRPTMVGAYTSSSQGDAYIDGAFDESGSLADWGQVALGKELSARDVPVCNLYLLVCLSGRTSLEEREKIQGWAAHKADRSGTKEPLSNLPDSHPYKDSPPTV